MVAVTAVGFPRAVKIRFSNEAIEFESLSVNGATLHPAPPLVASSRWTNPRCLKTVALMVGQR